MGLQLRIWHDLICAIKLTVIFSHRNNRLAEIIKKSTYMNIQGLYILLFKDHQV